MVPVRIIIPTYNRATLLEQALQSVQAQTVRDFEVVVADDGSTDGTEALVRRIANDDARVRYLPLPHAGVAAARNAALAVPGDFKYVALLDSDDLWTPEHLERAVRVLDGQPDIDVVFARAERVDRSGTWDDHHRRHREGPQAAPLACVEGPCEGGALRMDPHRLHDAFIRTVFTPHTSTVVLRASAVERDQWFETDFVPIEDCEFHLWLAARGRRYAFFDDVHARACFRGDNLTGGRARTLHTALARCEAVLRYFERALQHYARTAADRQHVRGEIAYWSCLVAQCHDAQLQRARARAAYLKSLRFGPSYWALRRLLRPGVAA
jgi:glycosyltransferase involved in cell wall biosynthesis